MPALDVFAIGTPVIDYFAKVKAGEIEKLGLTKGSTNHFSERERLDEFEKGIRILQKAPGDNARNFCEGVCFLGGKCAYGGAIGKDEDGELFSGSLKKCGIENKLEVMFKRQTGKIITLITEGGERTFAADLAASAWYERVEKDSIKDSEFFYLTSITAFGASKTAATAKDAIKDAMEHGVRIAYSLESPKLVKEGREEIWKIIQAGVYVLFANEEEFSALGKGIGEIAEIVPVFCLKKGANGSEIYSKGKKTEVSAVKVEKVVDTTGAGDAYAAGFVFGLSRGNELKECGRMGSELAGRVISKIGAGLGD